LSCSYIAYVDESGDEGFQFTNGSSKWFVISAVLVARDRELTEVKLVDDVRDQINAIRLPQHRIPDKKPLHFRDLKHEARKYYSTKVGAAQLKLVSVCIYKPDLTSPEVFQKEFRLYFYATRLLVERISWCCRDHTRKNLPGDGSVEIIFSNRGYMDYRAMCGYLERLEADPAAHDYRADLNVVKSSQVQTMSPGKRMGLQIADAVAASTYFALESNDFGQTEDAYLRAISPRLYRQNGEPWGYGMKLMPKEAEEKRRRGELIISLAQ